MKKIISGILTLSLAIILFANMEQRCQSRNRTSCKRLKSIINHMWIVKVLRLQECGRGFLYPCLDQAVQYFQEHYNQPLSIKEYAAAHNLSEGWFIQNFKQYTNSTPAQYLLSLRIHNAKVLLESTNYNVTEISNIIGYENPLYFSRIFKKQTGFSPSEYRKKIFSEDNSTHSVSIISPD